MASKLIYILLLVTSGLFGQTITLADSDILALGVADGYGKDASGGRGYGVYFVTNLNNSGTGSLRQALADADSAGGGNIIFRLGGTVEITADLYIPSNVTIWGSSAPGDGIAIHGDSVWILNDSNVIVENVRFRKGDTGGSTDTFSVSSSGSYNLTDVMIDQCSFSWGGDENVSFARQDGATGDVSGVTLQRSIIASGFGDKGTLLYWEVNGITIRQCAYINNYDRNIRSSTGTSEWEFHNNVIYNFYGSHNAAYGSQFDAIGNVFKKGPQGEPYGGGLFAVSAGQAGETFDITDTDCYISDNVNINFSASMIESELSPRVAGARLFSATTNILAGSVAKDTVFANAGARARTSGLDALDTEYFADYEAGTGDNTPANEAATSGLPTLSSGTAYTDADSDGIPDSFETDNGGDLTNTTRYDQLTLDDGSTVVDQSGVTSYASNGLTALEVAMWELRLDWDYFETTGGGGSTSQIRIRPWNVRTSSGSGVLYINGQRVN